MLNSESFREQASNEEEPIDPVREVAGLRWW